MKRLPAVLLSCVLGLQIAAAQDPQTVAEQSDFRATSSYDETLEFLDALTSTSQSMVVESYGR